VTITDRASTRETTTAQLIGMLIDESFLRYWWKAEGTAARIDYVKQYLKRETMGFDDNTLYEMAWIINEKLGTIAKAMLRATA